MRILFIPNKRYARIQLRNTLEPLLNAELDSAFDVQHALAQLQNEGPYNVVIHDMNVQSDEDLFFFYYLSRKWPSVIRILLGENPASVEVHEALQLGVLDCFHQHPLQLNSLRDDILHVQSIRSVLKKHRISTPDSHRSWFRVLGDLGKFSQSGDFAEAIDDSNLNPF